MVRHACEHLIDEESIAAALMLPLQSAGINGPELVTQEVNRFAATVMPFSAGKPSISRWLRLKQ